MRTARVQDRHAAGACFMALRVALMMERNGRFSLAAINDHSS